MPIQPVPKHVFRSLNILFVTALLAFVSTFPYFAPENIFITTSSRLQTSNDVLFTRLSLLRQDSPLGGFLTEEDQLLKPKLASLDSRLLYLTYGPDVLTNCPFCVSDEPLSYLYYALPSLLLPHVLHAFALGFATSSAIGGKETNRWRTLAASFGIALAVVECWLFSSYDWKANARAVRPEQYVHFYWRMRIVRGVAIAAVDLLMAYLLYLASTNRFFVVPPSHNEKMEAAMRLLDAAKGKMNAVGIIRNVTVRDEALRRKGELYWKREGQIMGEVMDEREVVEGVRNALSGRVHISKVEEDARKYAEAITSWNPTQTQTQPPEPEDATS